MLETVIKLGQLLTLYAASNYFSLCTTGTTLCNICQMHGHNVILPEKMLENDLKLLGGKERRQLLPRPGVK